MSARVLHPTKSEMSRNIFGGARASPDRAALARVRRNLFGPVDHAAARAVAERELLEQSLLDQEKWGFDFRLGVPKINSRFEWQIVGPEDEVLQPYALRGMTYLREHAPRTPQKVVEKKEKRCDEEKTQFDLEDNRVPENGEATETTLSAEFCFEKGLLSEPKTPVPNGRSSGNQTIITNFMKNRKRKIIESKTAMEPAQKVNRKADQIRN